jgi:deoxyribodipyrimidine photo-lyase
MQCIELEMNFSTTVSVGNSFPDYTTPKTQYEMTKKRAIVWFRQDLRLHDNEALWQALKNADEIIPVFVFDERVFKGKTTHFGFPKTGKFRAKFVIESVADLRTSLQKMGSNLIVRIGKPEEIIFQMATEFKTSWVFCNRERTDEELLVQDSLEQKLWTIGQEIYYSRGKMLYYTQDLPFPVPHTPDIFTTFRKEVEKITPVRAPLPVPQSVKPYSVAIEIGEMPVLQDFGHEIYETDVRAVLPFKGGETEGLNRLRYYLWETNKIKKYKETRNELIGGDYSSKFSLWLAHGCLSPKMIYQEIQQYERERGANESTYWLFFELLWRDFFRLMGKKYGNKIFQKGGIFGSADRRWRDDKNALQTWADGQTGVPFIDANMRELTATGFMSNRGRQNVASFLVKDLFVNWVAGAEYFESQLIDYDPCSNYCNWNYVAGVGTDPRENRYFNILTQAKNYDAKGEYARLWCPELADVPPDKVHRPDTFTAKEQACFHVKIGVDYPKPMVNMAKWEK